MIININLPLSLEETSLESAAELDSLCAYLRAHLPAHYPDASIVNVFRVDRPSVTALGFCQPCALEAEEDQFYDTVRTLMIAWDKAGRNAQ